MRFLILIRGGDPSDEVLGRYHEDLVRAGVLLTGDLTAGFWLLEVDSPAEASEWGRRVPPRCGEVEIRRVAADR